MVRAHCPPRGAGGASPGTQPHPSSQAHLAPPPQPQARLPRGAGRGWDGAYWGFCPPQQLCSPASLWWEAGGKTDRGSSKKRLSAIGHQSGCPTAVAEQPGREATLGLRRAGGGREGGRGLGDREDGGWSGLGRVVAQSRLGAQRSATQEPAGRPGKRHCWGGAGEGWEAPQHPGQPAGSLSGVQHSGDDAPAWPRGDRAHLRRSGLLCRGLGGELGGAGQGPSSCSPGLCRAWLSGRSLHGQIEPSLLARQG